MSAVDFEQWAAPDLILPFRGRTYTVRPPSVGMMPKVLAAAVRGEVNLGIVKGPIPDAVQRILDSIEPGEHPSLGDVYDQLVADGIDPVTIDRIAYFAVFYWARGQAYAESIAEQLWAPRITSEDVEVDEAAIGGEGDPKSR